MLNELSSSYEQLNPRTRSAILGIASISLKFCSFMMDNEEEILLCKLKKQYQTYIIKVRNLLLLFHSSMASSSSFIGGKIPSSLP
jgi:hypothetical protein